MDTMTMKASRISVFAFSNFCDDVSGANTSNSLSPYVKISFIGVSFRKLEKSCCFAVLIHELNK